MRGRAKSAGWRSALKTVCSLSAESFADEMLDFKSNRQTMQSKHCGQELRKALEMLEFSTANVKGTEGARVFQRHANTAFRRRFGAQSLFATVNWADSRTPMLVLLFDGVDGKMKLTEPMPAMPSLNEMKQILGADPIGHAIFYRTMMNLFVETVMGAAGPGFCEPLHPDGVAARTYAAAGGLYGAILAGYGPEENQGRGSEHAHMAWWFVKNIYKQLFRKIAEEKEAGTLRATINAWAAKVKAAAATMQFSSVHEMAGVLGVVPPADMGPLRTDQTGQSDTRVPETWEQRVPRLPLTARRQKQLKVDGASEGDVAETRRPLLLPTPPQEEPNATPDLAFADWPLTKTVLARNPPYLCPPPYALDEHGRWIQPGDGDEAGAVAWAWTCAKHGRDIVACTHMHTCTDTCFKYSPICRFDFFQILELLMRKPDEAGGSGNDESPVGSPRPDEGDASTSTRCVLKKVFRRGKALRSEARGQGGRTRGGGGGGGGEGGAVFRFSSCSFGPVASVLFVFRFSGIRPGKPRQPPSWGTGRARGL